MSNKRLGILTFLPVLSFTILSGCNRPDLISAWRDHEIVINGKYTDFGNVMTYYYEKEKIAINLFNDKDYMYICLISRNRRIETQLMESGLTLWFDPDGGRNKVFGIRFPLGRISITKEESNNSNWQEQEEGKDAGEEKDGDENSWKQLEALEGSQEKIELIIESVNAENKDMLIELSLKDAIKQGIEAKIGHQNDYFVYELKVPLIKSSQHQYAVGFKVGKPMGFGLGTVAKNAGMYRNGGGEHMPKGGGIRGSRVEMPSEMGEEGVNPGESFQLWTTITLSSKTKNRPF